MRKDACRHKGLFGNPGKLRAFWKMWQWTELFTKHLSKESVMWELGSLRYRASVEVCTYWGKSGNSKEKWNGEYGSCLRLWKHLLFHTSTSVLAAAWVREEAAYPQREAELHRLERCRVTEPAQWVTFTNPPRHALAFNEGPCKHVD